MMQEIHQMMQRMTCLIVVLLALTCPAYVVTNSLTNLIVTGDGLEPQVAGVYTQIDDYGGFTSFSCTIAPTLTKYVFYDGEGFSAWIIWTNRSAPSAADDVFYLVSDSVEGSYYLPNFPYATGTPMVAYNIVTNLWTSPPRFFDHGDGTVTDRKTSLMWLKDASAGGIRTWDDATNYIANLTTNGYSDWRLGSVTNDGNVAELDTLGRRDGQTTNVWDGVEDSPFLNVDYEGGYFWSSIVVTGNVDNAWRVYVKDGTVASIEKVAGQYVWPVRGPVPIPPYQFEIQGASISEINMTGAGCVISIPR